MADVSQSVGKGGFVTVTSTRINFRSATLKSCLLEARRALLLICWSICWLFSVPCGAVDAGGTLSAKPTPFTSSTYGFGLILPRDWVSIPIDLINTQLTQQAGSQLAPQVTAAAAFQRGPAADNIKRPYCMVQTVPTGWRGGPTDKQFDLVIKAMSAGAKVFDAEGGVTSMYTPDQVAKFRAVLADTSPGPVHVDRSAHRYWRLVDGTDSSSVAVRSLTTGMFLRSGTMISLNCYSNRSNFARDVGDFAAINGSLRDLSQQ